MKKRYNDQNYQVVLRDWDLQSLPLLDEEFSEIRKDLENLFQEINSLADIKSDKYLFDMNFGVRIKDYFDKKDWFNLRLAGDINFWRYLSVFVIPHLVLKRWGEKADDRYWQKPARIWLRSIWWFAYIGWASSTRETISVLCSRNFNTDVILNTVERTGKKGTHIEAYKEILHAFSELSAEQIKSYVAKSDSETLFRAIMKLNTAKILVLEPSLCCGGCRGYVKNLFSSLGIVIE